MRIVCLAVSLLFLRTQAADQYSLTRPTTYSGMADASGAVAINDDLFAAASDEDNILRLYRKDRGGEPIQEFDFSAFLELSGKSPEVDLEAGARLGDLAFWIGSHGRNVDGKKRPNRCRLFATRITIVGEQVRLTPEGKPYQHLLADLEADRRLAFYQFKQAARLAPKARGGLNIEGLAATPQGQLLIGFRNPVPNGKALLVPLLNPQEVIRGTPARLGLAIELNLGGLGIRDIVLHDGQFLISAGPRTAGGPFRFYRWEGPGTLPLAMQVPDLRNYNPEAIIIYPASGLRQIQVLSDDGVREVDGVREKDLSQPSQREFRSFWLESTNP